MRVGNRDCVATAELDPDADAHADVDTVFDASGLALSLRDTALVMDGAGEELTDLETSRDADNEGVSFVESVAASCSDADTENDGSTVAVLDSVEL